MTAAPTAAETCPHCAAETVTVGHDRPWCPSCEWNLADGWTVVSGWDWVDRRLQRLARRLTTGQFDALADGPAVPRRMTAARAITLGASALLLTGIATIAGLGLWLVLVDFFSILTVLGLALLGVAWLLRPRVGRLGRLTEDARVIEPAAAPELFRLIGRVAEAVGAPKPDILLFDAGLNAYTTTVGLRRRRVLGIGLPLWVTLDPQERVALLGHELGHFVNGDVRRSLLTQVAGTTLGTLADTFAEGAQRRGAMGIGAIVELIEVMVSWVLCRVVLAVQLLLLAISLRDSQRAEYLADDLGARAGGSAAGVRLDDYFLAVEAIATVIRREARAGNGMAAWRAAAVTARASLAARIPLLRHRSRHADVSLFASHPPPGLRAEMGERRPQQPAAVVLTEPVAARIDDELAVHQEWARRELASDW